MEKTDLDKSENTEAVEDVVKEKPRVYTVHRGFEMEDKVSWNYSGATCTNSFKVDKPITLTSIGFYGPFKGEAMYKILVEIYQDYSETVDRYSKKMVEIKEKVYMPMKKIYDLPVPNYKIDPGQWVHIVFMLEGPDTATLKEKELDKGTRRVLLDDNEIVKFIFMRGSKQMPTLKFTIP